MRIITGRFKGARLYALEGNEVRPTLDRVRESLFNIIGAKIEGANFLDLYSGTGAVGLEAFSRGASGVTFVELSHIDLIQKNFSKLKISPSENCHVIRGHAIDAVKKLKSRGELFDIVFADPPWNAGEEAEIVKNCADVLREGGWLIVEANRKTPVPSAVPPLALLESRRYGDTVLHFFK